MIDIKIATSQSDYLLIETLADKIWREHYIPITGIAQVEHMLKKYQSAQAIAIQISEGFQYYIFNYKETPVGYLAILKEEQSLFLSKIYVLSNYRGKKIGKTAMQFIEAKTKAFNCTKIKLTVNKNNVNSIGAYGKLGFKNLGPVVKDIGEGFIMDDFLFEKELQ